MHHYYECAKIYHNHGFSWREYFAKLLLKCDDVSIVVKVLPSAGLERLCFFADNMIEADPLPKYYIFGKESTNVIVLE